MFQSTPPPRRRATRFEYILCLLCGVSIHAPPPEEGDWVLITRHPTGARFNPRPPPEEGDGMWLRRVTGPTVFQSTPPPEEGDLQSSP